MQEAKTIDLANPLHVPRCLRIAEKHKKIADKWKNRAIAEARRFAKVENADPRRGLKKVAKQISRHAANSLRYVVRDTKAADGRKTGTLTANPKIIDGVITRAWQEVYEGNAKNPDALVEAFVKKYKKTLLKREEYVLQELTTQEVYDRLTSGGKTAGGMDGWEPAELALVSWNTMHMDQGVVQDDRSRNTVAEILSSCHGQIP